MMTVFKEMDAADMRTMQLLKKSISDYSKKGSEYLEVVKREKKKLRDFMARFFPTEGPSL